MTEETEPTPPIPPTLGRYRVLRRLGKGGMAEVFLARSTGAEGIEKLLVVKRVLPSFAQSARFIAMFTSEAKVAVRLNHPNIVQVYGFEQVGDQFLLAMEYVDGMDLGRLLGHCRSRRVRMPHAVAAYMAMEVAKGLDYAHNRRDDDGEPLEIVHRDVSPQNVLLTAEGVVKIADFGVAKARRMSEEPGVLKGKVAYMAPEQARGETVDRRSDVYSLGVLLAELLLGRPVYPQGDQLALLERVRRGDLPLPRPLATTVPDDLERVVRRATALDPEERFQSARSFAGALGRWLHAQDDMHDAETVERFLARMAPREVPSAAMVAPPEPTATLGSLAEREVREHRPVVVVSGRLPTGDETGADIDRIEIWVRRVLDDIAYKTEAALSWPREGEAHHFRFVLGLGAPSLHDPLTAVRLALDVREALEGLSADLLTPLVGALAVSRGVLRTSRDARGRLLRYEPADDVLEVTDGLCEAAEPGEVLVSGEVYRLVRRVYGFDHDGTRTVDLGEPAGPEAPRRVRAYRLRGARTREERAADVGAVGELIGRRAERQRLREAYEQAVQSRRTVFVAVTGEVGVGKTALVAGALREMAPSPRVLRTEGAFGTIDLPFAATAELVREALGIDDDSPPDECRQRLVRGVRALIDDSSRGDAVIGGLESLLIPAAEEAGEPDAERSVRIKRSVEWLVSALAQRGPMVVWVDALQWIDASSLDVVRLMLQRTYDAPVLVVLAGRPEPRVAPALASVPRVEVSELADGDERRALIQRRFDGAEVPEDVSRAILERAGGNPYFLIELVEALLERDEVRIEIDAGVRRVVRRTAGPFALPATVEGVLAARLAELGREEREAARWLAVAGPGMTATDLAALAGADLSRGLEDLVARGLVDRRPGGAYGFPNAVVRHVAYDTTDPDDRLRMHRRTAGYLREMGRAAPAAQMARHLELSGDRVGAADAYVDGARGAARSHSDSEAFRLYGRALPLLGADSPRRFWVHEAREALLRQMGHGEARDAELQAMGRVATHRGEGRLIAVWRLRRARLALERGDLQAASDEIGRAGQEPDRDRPTEIETWLLTARLRAAEGRLESALEACDQALARAGLSSEWLEMRARTTVVRSEVLVRLERPDEAVATAAEGLVLFRRLGAPGTESRALAALGAALAAQGRPEEAVATLRAALALDAQTGDRSELGPRLAALADLYERVGDVGRADTLRQRAGLA
ncbi:MAG: protein kinase domain-containing protein [Myxococcota bacterium]